MLRQIQYFVKVARCGSFSEAAKQLFVSQPALSVAVQKLEELGYVRSEADAHDRRVRRLYATEGAEPVVRESYAARLRWNELLTQGMTPEEAEAAKGLIARIAENAILALEQEEKENHGI